jgi:hypothetical protein
LFFLYYVSRVQIGLFSFLRDGLYSQIDRKRISKILVLIPVTGISLRHQQEDQSNRRQTAKDPVNYENAKKFNLIIAL